MELYTKIFLVYLLIINVMIFCLFAWDKRQARKNAWRIRERTFFILSALGGSVGGLFGMYIFRHKTKHVKFKIGFPLILLIQLGLLIYVMWY